MGTYALRVLVLVGIVGAGLLLLVEIRKWRVVGDLISRRQKTLRVCQFVLFETLLVMIFSGPLPALRGNPFTELAYWLIALWLVVAILAMALMDVREVAARSAEVRKRVIRGLREEDKPKK